MANPAIRVVQLGKRYRIGASRLPYRTLRDSFSNGLRSLAGSFRHRRKEVDRPDEIWALKGLDFEITLGEVVGVIGRNGAGKSTLLKILAHITSPTTGRVELRGRVGSLLEVGTGFSSELTGRDNIYLNGAILGMHKAEIERKFDEIVAFAEVEKFLDTPVKHYSSGMYMRLAFAVAAHLETEILLVDEVLAVGDAAFQKKCLGKMGEVAHQGRTVLFVSHQMNAIETLCTRAFLLKQGQLVQAGPADEVVRDYLASFVTKDQVGKDELKKVANRYFSPTNFQLVDEHLRPLERDLRADEGFGILIEGQVEEMHAALTVGFSITNSEGITVLWANQTDQREEDWPKLEPGRHRLVAWVPARQLNEGDYTIELMMSLHYLAWLSQPGVNAPVLTLRVRGGLSESPHWILPRPGIVVPVVRFHQLLEEGKPND